jgi:hypothetical protein
MAGAKWRWMLPLLVLLITAAVYVRTLEYEFVYDDHGQIEETTQLSSWSMVPHYFTGHVWSWKSPNARGPYYRPLFLLWLLLNRSLFDLSPAGWHLTSVLLHLVVTFMVYMITRRLTGDIWTAAIASLWFGVHPAHIESVAWISAVTEPLMCALLLGALFCFWRKGRAWHVWSLALFSAALLAKETALVFPVLVLAYDWLLGSKRITRALAVALPYLAVTAVYLGVRLQVLHGLTMTITPMGRREVIFTWPSMFVFYLQHLIWPVGLTAFYHLPTVPHPAFLNFYLPTGILLLVAGGMTWWARREPLAGFCAIAVFATLLPVLDLRVFARDETVHDRYLYLPSIGFCILAAFAVSRLSATRGIRRQIFQPIVAAGIVLLLTAGMVWATVDQESQWADNVSLFERGLAISPNNSISAQGKGTSLLLKNHLSDAISYYQRALAINPEMYEANYGLARCYYELHMYPEAEPYFKAAAGIKPDEPMLYLYYGLTEFHQERLDIAERAVRHGMQLKGPDDVREYHLSLGQILERKGDLKAALAECEAEVLENPEPGKGLDCVARLKARLSVE